jgi:hypothetical protein
VPLLLQIEVERDGKIPPLDVLLHTSPRTLEVKSCVAGQCNGPSFVESIDGLVHNKHSNPQMINIRADPQDADWIIAVHSDYCFCRRVVDETGVVGFQWQYSGETGPMSKLKQVDKDQIEERQKEAVIVAVVFFEKTLSPSSSALGLPRKKSTWREDRRRFFRGPSPELSFSELFTCTSESSEILMI